MKNENSFKINIKQREETFCELLPKAAAVFAAATGFSGMAFSAFGVTEPLFGMIIGIIAAVCLFFLQKKLGKYIPFAIAAVCFLAVLIVPDLRNGMLLLANKVCEFMTSATGEIHLPFETIGESFAAESLFLLVLALSALLSTGLILPMAVAAALGIISGFLSIDAYFAVFATGFIATVLLFFALQSGTKITAKALVSLFATAGICVLVSAVLINFVPADAGTKLKVFAEEKVHSVLFDSKTNAMPEGKLKNLGAFNKNGAQAIEVTMEKQQKLYLKGFVGEVYTGNGWKSLGNDVLSEYAEDFYNLHKDGFYGQSAVASALEATEQQEKSAMSIKNLSACSKITYLPYAVSAAPFDERKIGDKTDCFGEEYEISYISGGLLEWYSAQVKLSEKQGSHSKIDEHLANEYIYREFVKNNYLDVPKEAFEAIEKAFEGEDASTATEIISAVLVYLEKNVTYDEKVVTRNGNEDFAAYFLGKTARGYSVHYATAATLMLRYFGIPARYVEGYFLSAEDAENYENGRAIVLTEENAHAWAEYYLEGVGWIPFETTPGYMDDELEKAAFRTSGESSKRYEQSELPETNVEQDRPKDDITEVKKDNTAIIIAVVSVPVVLLIAAVCYVFVMRKRFKKALSDIDSADNKTAVPLRFGYAQKLIGTLKASETEGYEEAFAINKEALFSKHEISDEQRKVVDDFAKKVLSECKNSWNLWQKIKYKFIKFIY